MEDLLSDWDDSAVDSIFFNSLLKAQHLRPVSESDILEVLSPAYDESSSSALSFASTRSCHSDTSNYSQLTSCSNLDNDICPSVDSCDFPSSSQSTDESAEIIASDPLLKNFLEMGNGLARCLFFRNPNSQYLIVAQSLSCVGNGRRHYDNLNMLEGLGLLKRGPVAVIEGTRYRLFTWYGDSFIVEDFRRIYRHGTETGLVSATEALQTGRNVVRDTFTSAVNINHEETYTYSLETRKPRGKCPMKVGIQRVLVILLAANAPLNVDAIMNLLRLPYPDVNLQRRYFYIRDILIHFGLARVSKQDEFRSNCFEYCGPTLFEKDPIGSNILIPVVPMAIPIFVLKENLLTPLTVNSCLLSDESTEPTRNDVGKPTPSVSETLSTNDIPASLLDSLYTSSMSENSPPSPDDGSDVEESLLRCASNTSSVLRRTDTLLAWTNS